MNWPPDGELELEVAAIRQETPLIRSFVLRPPPGGAALPEFEAGAHIEVRPPGFGKSRCYSLINVDPGAWAAPAAYRIAVRLDEAGQGGSRAMHALAVGDRVTAGGPRNDFPLAPGAGPAALIAGGVGVTPLLSMAAALRQAGRPFRAVYSARSRSHLAFADEFSALAPPGHLRLHCDDEHGGAPIDIPALFAGFGEDVDVYVCGPQPMIEAALAEGRRLGWRPDRVRYELFSVAPKADDHAFEIELRQSGKVFAVPPGRTILDILLEAGEDPLHDCRRGDCGICQCTVLDGEPDHRDFVLTEAERAEGKLIQICVSRARSPRLVLDL